MFARGLALFVTISTTSFLVAAAPTQPGASQCNTGSLHCCNTIQMRDFVSDLLGLGNGGSSDIPTGITCSPINVYGLGNGGQCAAQPACCEQTPGAQLACSPITLNS